MLYYKKDKNNTRQIILPRIVSVEDKDSFFTLISDFINSEMRTLELEFQETQKIDSAGLGFLLIASQYCSDCNKSIILKNPKGKCKDIFNLMRFENLFTIKYDVDEFTIEIPSEIVLH